MGAEIRHINSGKPFVDYAKKYVDKGWSVIPLPKQSKELRLTGVTGHYPVPTAKQIKKWVGMEEHAEANIALRLGNKIIINHAEYEVIGIDVDHYGKKKGGEALAALERKLGKLPETYIGTARSDGISGIRLFLVPVGYRFRGSCGNSIEIIQRRHRYAACFPSWHPKVGGQYFWYAPGVAPDGGQSACDLFSPADLPILSADVGAVGEAWLKYLTRGFTLDEGEKYEFDLSITTSNLYVWANKVLPLDNLTYNFSKGMCPGMIQRVDMWYKDIEESDTIHDKLVEAHWNILMYAKEGHYGWAEACKLIELAIIDKVKERGEPRGVVGEIRRSKENALRKIKGLVDWEIETGECANGDEFSISGIGACTCAEVDPGLGDNDEIDPIINAYFPMTKSLGVDKYEMNDDGNGLHFLNKHDGIVYYIDNVLKKWILWTGSRWMVDDKKIVKHLFRRVKKAQQEYANKLWKEYDRVKGQAGAGRVRTMAVKWSTWAQTSGKVAAVNNALAAAESMGVIRKYEELDADPMMLGVGDKVIKFELDGSFKFIEHDKSLLITKNTETEYIPLAEQAAAGASAGGVGDNYLLFMDFINKFLFDPDYLAKLFGYCMLGVNNTKKAIFLYGETDTGKSTFQNLLVNALGKGHYADWREPRIFRNKDLNPMLASALPMHVICVGELGKGEIHSELFKRLTGNEPIACELKGLNDGVIMKPRCTLIVGTNSVPNIPEEDKATRNRILAVPFKHQVVGEENDRNASDVISERCKVPMLAWLIEGCARALREGLEPYPDEIIMTTKEFVSGMSELGTFVTECLELATDDLRVKYRDSVEGWPDAWVINEAEMWEKFDQWQTVNVRKSEQITKAMLTRRLKSVGIKQEGKIRVEEKILRKWVGVRFLGPRVRVG